MKIIIQPKNLDISDALQNFIEERIGSLKKFIDILKEDTLAGQKTLAEVFVEVEKETEHHKKGKIFSCKLEVRLPGKLLVVKSQNDDPNKAIVEAKKAMREEIEKYKFKNVDRNRREQRKAKRESTR
jgi:ribosomal subunit interface protein